MGQRCTDYKMALFSGVMVMSCVFIQMLAMVVYIC